MKTLRLKLVLLALLVSACFDSNDDEPTKTSKDCEFLMNRGQESKMIACLNALPKEDIKLNPEVKQYLENHPVYISMTTSPLRLDHIHSVLETIDLDLVTEILLVLPKKFKNQEAYPDPIPETIIQFPKVKILRPDFDYGPISKLVPALEYASVKDPKAIIITIDDDTAYPIGIFGQLIKFQILNRMKLAVGTVGQESDFWNLNPKYVFFENQCHTNSTCDLIEGFGAIAYVAGKTPLQKLIEFSKVSNKCRLSDDLVINYALEYSGVKRFKLNRNPYISSVLQMEYGFRPDALHQQHTYSRSYQECVEDIEAKL